MNENENDIYNLCDAAKAILRGKLIAVNPNIKKDERCQINNITF